MTGSQTAQVAGSTPWWLRGWPGGRLAWAEGSWRGLAVAGAFSVWLALAVLLTTVWTEVLVGWGAVGLWALLGIAWWGGCVWTHRAARHWAALAAAPEPASDLYPQAVREYLRGNWFQVETLCETMVRKRPRDVEAVLLWATLLRHTGRPADARRKLMELEGWDESSRWQWEIRRERERLGPAPAEPDVPAGLRQAA